MASAVVHAVSNTSPVNYLLLIDEIGILPQLYGRVLVPLAVVNELGHFESPSIVRNWAMQPPAWIDVGLLPLNRMEDSQTWALENETRFSWRRNSTEVF